MGREFIDFFDKWAETYDDTVSGQGEEYQEVFEKYDEILLSVAKCAKGTVVEFGVGTGNLTEKLLGMGLTTYGVEPSSAMREKVKEKFVDLPVYDGDFLNLPSEIKNIDTIVSSYAFHHLTDEEKYLAIRLYQDLLPEDGKIVFADTVYDSLAAKELIIKDAKDKGYLNLLKDLQTEYYTTVDIMKDIFESSSFKVEFTRLNKYVMLINATKV